MQFGVKLIPSGRAFSVDGHTKLLSAGLAAGSFLPYSCRQGSCGTCRAKVLEGHVAYGDAEPAYLTSEGRARGEVLLCQATALSDLIIEVHELEGFSGLKPRMVPCRVTAIDHPSSEVAVLKVRLPMNEHMRFAAGQYVEFRLEDGMRRVYSIAAMPKTEGVTELEFHIRNFPGGKFSERVFQSMKLREILWFEGPLGTFFIREGTKPIILCATGTGYAPIKSMLAAALAGGLHEQRPITFYWGARTPEGLYDLERVKAWARQYPAFRFVPVLSGGAHERLAEARLGHVQDAVLHDTPDLSNTELYACGSSAMVEGARHALIKRGALNPQDFYSDEFLPASEAAAPVFA